MFQKILYLLLLIFTTTQKYIPVYDIVGNITTLIDSTKEKNYYESAIDSIIEVMKNYAYINILKSPPKVDGKDYFTKVDIIKDLQDLKENIDDIKNFYEFYQKITKIIFSAKDFHILFGYFGQETPLIY